MTLPDSLLAGAPRLGVLVVQVTLTALLGLLAWLGARRGGPALRGAILLASLVAALAVPGLAAVAPTWVALPEWLCPAEVGAAPAEAEGARPSPTPASAVAPARFTLVVERPAAEPSGNREDAPERADDTMKTGAKTETVRFTVTPVAEEPVSHTGLGVDQSEPAPASPALSLGGLLVIVWLVGVALVLARSVGSLVLLYRCTRRAEPVREAEWTARMAALAGRYGLPEVALRESPDVRSPITLGLSRPVILLPPGRRDWPVAERDLILGHELAHVARRDFRAGLLAELAACVFWFHPLVRWLVARLRLEQEYAADAWVAATLGDTQAYVRCLARLALERGEKGRSLALAFWRRRPEILRRIDMLRQNPKGHRPRLGKGPAWTVAVTAVAAGLAVAGVGRLHSAAEVPGPAPSASEAPARAAADGSGDPLPAGAVARLGTTRFRHAADVTFVAFGPGGKTLLTAGRDNTVRVWDLATRKELRRFTRPKPIPVRPPEKGDKAAKEAARARVMMMMAAGGGAGGGFRVALSPDGKTLAGAGDNVIQLWDVETGKELRQIAPPAGSLGGLLFSPDGRTLAGRSTDGDIYWWAADTGKLIHHVEPAHRQGDTGSVLVFGGDPDAGAPGMAFSPDGKTLAAATIDHRKQETVHAVKFWDVTTGKELRKIPSPAAVSAVAIAPGGKVLAFGRGSVVHLCEADTGKEVRQIQAGAEVAALAFPADGKTLAVRGRNHQVQLWETGTGKAVRKLSDAEPPRQTGGLVFVSDEFAAPEERTLAVSPDGRYIASASGSTVRLWDAATGKELPLPEGHRRAPTAIVVSPDGKTAVSWGDDRMVRRWEVATGKELGAFAAPPGTTQTGFSADGALVALANADNTIGLHDTATGRERSRLKVRPGGIVGLAFAPDGRVLATRGGDNTIRLYDLARGVELRQMRVRPRNNAGRGTVLVIAGGGGPPGTGPALAFAPQGNRIVVPLADGGGPGKDLVVLDATTGKELRRIETAQPVVSFAFAPDGRTIATENADRTVTLWEVASGKERARLGKPSADRPQRNAGSMVFTIAVDGDGFLTGPGGPGGPVGVAFSPDGRALLERGPDRSVRVWDVDAGKELDRLQGHQGQIETVAFAPDGRSLASGGTDTTILLWDAAHPLKGLAKLPAVELSDSTWPAVSRRSRRSGISSTTIGPRNAASGLSASCAAIPTTPRTGMPTSTKSARHFRS
jgi:WD40 repeat protein/beta-lactamase regulating signal transducer with metallopeptidase domain